MLFLKTSTLTVYFEGITRDQNLELIEQMVNQVNSFFFIVVDGLLIKMKNCRISLAVLSPIGPGSFLELLDALSAVSTLLTNIQIKMMTVDFYTALLKHIKT